MMMRFCCYNPHDQMMRMMTKLMMMMMKTATQSSAGSVTDSVVLQTVELLKTRFKTQTRLFGAILAHEGCVYSVPMLQAGLAFLLSMLPARGGGDIGQTVLFKQTCNLLTSASLLGDKPAWRQQLIHYITLK